MKKRHTYRCPLGEVLETTQPSNLEGIADFFEAYDAENQKHKWLLKAEFKQNSKIWKERERTVKLNWKESLIIRYKNADGSAK